ncbi:MAG TPA: hypothetical protein VJN18_25585 [Polyangiaceae bacterium]|nr:hypothetical protein [Polyangiaceae bacterium]
MPRPILLASCLVFAGLGTTALVIREVRLQADQKALRDLAHLQSGRLGEILEKQRELLTISANVNRKVERLTEHSSFTVCENSPAKGDAAKGDREVTLAAESQPELQPSPEVLEKANEARRLVDAAIVAGLWTDQNRQELRDMLRILPAAQAEPLKHQLIAALNARKLEMLEGGPPF